jgi:glycosyltransferase involved in cell wall biosynthesis
MESRSMIVGLLRIKNESRWIERVVKSIQPVCGRILILDDHSTDGTPEICESLGCQVFRSPFEGIHEARDKDYLLERAWESGAAIGDYCLMIDGDEALHSDDVPALFAAASSGAVCCSTHIVYLWDREDQVRVDRWYREFRRPSLFRLTARNLTFRRTEHGGNLHCSSAPAQLLSQITPIPVRLLHFGYLHREDRVRKFHWYNSIDPHNELEDQYRHMVVGDLFPAEAAFRWAGPLRLEALCSHRSAE